MRKLKTLLSVLLLALCTGVYAQTARTITGKITGSGALPVPGATVTEKGTRNSKVTDDNGSFSITVNSASPVLVISSVGYGTKEVTVEAGSDVVNTSLETVKGELNEVVVTALGITRQTKSLVYATQTVKPAELVEVRDPNNVINSLQGKVANALIVQGSGGPGSGAKIVLRGNRSIQGGNTALIVVDGVPLNNVTYSTAGSDFGSVQSSYGASSINPDDIESMTVLRGASAAALYGSQAGNGVLVISTKKGKKNTPTAVNLNSGIAFESPFALPKFQNVYGQGNSGELNTDVGQSWGAKMQGQADSNALGQPTTYSPQKNNVKDFFHTGMSLNNYVSFASGGEHTQGYLSYTNNNVQGIIPRNSMMRHNVTVRLTHEFTDKFTVDAKVTFLSQDIYNRPRTGEENSPVMDIYEMPRSYSLADAKKFETVDALQLPTPTPWPSTNSSIYQNPYWMINRTAISESRNRIMGFLTAKYQITPWLDIKGNANLDRYFDEDEEKYYQGTLLWAPGGGGNYIRTEYTNTQKWFDASLNGNNNFGLFKLQYHLGGIFQDVQFDQNQVNANGLNVANKFSLLYATAPGPNPNFVETQTQSVYGQATLSFKDAIYLDASLRNDWDSRLPKPYSFAYPSIGASVVISDLVKLPTPISFLKASLNYASVGNGGQPQILFNTYSYVLGAGSGGIQRNPSFAIPNLKPENVQNTEASIEARFMNDRLGFVVTAYKSKSTNQLLTLPLPSAAGYATQYLNAGNIQNKGLEVVLNATPTKTKNFSWDIALNFALNRNTVVKLSDELKSTPLGGGFGRSATPIVKEGGSFGDLAASEEWMVDTKGNRLVDASGLPVIGSPLDPKRLGNFNPRATAGLTNTFNIGPVFLRLLIDGRFGGVLVSGTEMNLAFSGVTEGTLPYREGGLILGGFTADGTANSKSVTAQQFWQRASGQRYGAAEFFTYDATSFRVREFSLGYNLPVSGTKFFKTARLSAVARNLFWLYRGSSTESIPGMGKRKMWFDPDMSLGNGNFQGIEYGTMPSTRSLGFNLQLGF